MQFQSSRTVTKSTQQQCMWTQPVIHLHPMRGLHRITLYSVVTCFTRQAIGATPRLTDGVLGPDNLHSPTTDYAYTLAGPHRLLEHLKLGYNLTSSHMYHWPVSLCTTTALDSLLSFSSVMGLVWWHLLSAHHVTVLHRYSA